MPSLVMNMLGAERQLTLSLSPVRNREMFSNHWLKHRLPLEPEYDASRNNAVRVLHELLDLWKNQRDLAPRYGDEAGLEESFIQPVLRLLGWHLKYQTYLDGREPDYALFVSAEKHRDAIHTGRTAPVFWEHAAIVADAKAWHVSLDRPNRINGRREYPPEQIEWYIDRSRLDFGILTNGRLWRLVPRATGNGKPRFQTYLEVDLPALLQRFDRAGELQLGQTGPEFEDFLVFCLLFSPIGHLSSPGCKTLAKRAADGSSEYALGVGEGLRDRVFEALQLCVEGFIGLPINGLADVCDLAEVQRHGLILLYRLLFIMYAEDRGLLPYRTNATYTNNRSLARHRNEISTRIEQIRNGLDRTDFSKTETTLWGDLQNLFDIVDHGHARYGVPEYNGGLFDLEANEFLSNKSISDWYLARVIDQLGRGPLPTGPSDDLYRVDYRDLAIQHLGGVYEGLLELAPRKAEIEMRLVRNESAQGIKELVIPSASPLPDGYLPTGVVYPPQAVYLANDKGERRRTGSYYNPRQHRRSYRPADLGCSLPEYRTPGSR